MSINKHFNLKQPACFTLIPLTPVFNMELKKHVSKLNRNENKDL